MSMLMPPAAKSSETAVAPRFDAFAALLSYLVPGLGQIIQGRVGKGVMFFLCVNALFFYGMFLGQWSNVFLADTAAKNPVWNLPRWINNVYNRPQFAGQFWVGIAAWPALWHYWHQDPNQPRGPIDTRADFIGKFQAAPSEHELNEMQRDGDKHWDLGWVYTVIAGVLNVLVIYDALAGPAFGKSDARPDDEKDKAAP